jgi:predicted lipoprotein with Yx(FWY)xxD motif/plastocyanin
MMIGKKWMASLFVIAFVFSAATTGVAAEATVDASASVTTDGGAILTSAQIAAELGVLQGDGGGVTEAYLAKTTTRIQAAILFLRLRGLEKEATEFTSDDNFADASQVGGANSAVMAYLKANPGLGWGGTGNNMFEPLAHITAQQFYKVMAEALGYKQGVDFQYDDTIAFAQSIGLSQIADAGSLRNRHVAVALVEALKAKVKGNDRSLADSLADVKIIAQAQANVLAQPGIRLASSDLGDYLVDDKGMALYLFTKDELNKSTCVDNCVKNWPIFYSETLQVGPGLNPLDFGNITREDGKKQTTFKGIPLYYFVKDAKPGDINGENVNKVWFVIKPSTIGIASDETLGSYMVDANGRTLYMYTKDSANESVCTGKCEENWPIYYNPSIQVSAPMVAGDFETIVRADGTKQTAYKGMPLYYYVKDEKPGDVAGQGVGKIWYVIDPTIQAAAEEAESSESEMSGMMDMPMASDLPKMSEASNKAEASAEKVNITDFAYDPETLTISQGTTVTFTNMDDVEHTVTAKDGTFDSGMLKKGKTYTHTFDQAGTYTIYCKPHPFMTMTITVK